MSNTLEIYVYAEHTPYAGRVVPECVLEDYENPATSDQWMCYRGTEEELVALAHELLATAAPHARGAHQRKVAKNLLECLGATE
jgi:hypothetical protein